MRIRVFRLVQPQTITVPMGVKWKLIGGTIYHDTIGTFDILRVAQQEGDWGAASSDTIFRTAIDSNEIVAIYNIFNKTAEPYQAQFTGQEFYGGNIFRFDGAALSWCVFIVEERRENE